MRLDNLGDVVMLGPALRALKAALPGAHLTLLASPGGALAAPLLPWVDDVLEHRALWQDASGRLGLDPGRELALVERLAAGRFDAAVIFTSFSQSPHPPAYACYLAGIPIRVGQSTEWAGAVLTHAVAAIPDGVHQVERNLSLVEGAGFARAGDALEVAVRDDDRERAAGLRERAGLRGRPYVLLAPGASAAARRYDPGRFARVAAALVADADVEVLLVGSERERDLVEAVHARAASQGVGAIAGESSVAELAVLVEEAALVVANNSGALHLADAVGTPAVILYAGTDRESEWRPRFVQAALLRRPTPCAPCRLFTCPIGHPCLDVPEDEVVAACRDLLAAAAAA